MPALSTARAVAATIAANIGDARAATATDRYARARARSTAVSVAGTVGDGIADRIEDNTADSIEGDIGDSLVDTVADRVADSGAYNARLVVLPLRPLPPFPAAPHLIPSHQRACKHTRRRTHAVPSPSLTPSSVLLLLCQRDSRCAYLMMAVRLPSSSSLWRRHPRCQLCSAHCTCIHTLLRVPCDDLPPALRPPSPATPPVATDAMS